MGLPRSARIIIPNNIYSIVTRVNNWNFIFSNPRYCEMFLEILREAREKYKFKLYGFCIMYTHVHLLIQSCDEIANISKIMHFINGKFARRFNIKNAQRGHFWLERFKSKLIEDDKHLKDSLIYFALNPVRAGSVNDPLKHTFSSIRALFEDIFSDLIDPLPQVLVDIVKEELLAIIKNVGKKTKKIVKKVRIFCESLIAHSFSKTQHFVGSGKYVEKMTELYCSTG